jgi:hypothetical protein
MRHRTLSGQTHLQAPLLEQNDTRLGTLTTV